MELEATAMSQPRPKQVQVVLGFCSILLTIAKLWSCYVTILFYLSTPCISDPANSRRLCKNKEVTVPLSLASALASLGTCKSRQDHYVSTTSAVVDIKAS